MIEIRYKPLGLRLWHWLNVVAISGALLTAYLRKGWLSVRTNSQIILAKSSEAGTPVSADSAKEMALQIRNQMWEWHYIIGFCIAGLLIFRFIVFVHTKKTNPGVLTKFHWRDKKKMFSNLIKSGYIVFYTIILYMTVSGLLLYFKKELVLNKDLTEFLKEIHEFMLWFFSLYIPVHIVGVFIAENLEDQENKGLVSNMINGGKN